jgi:hypothetical protein
MSILVVASGPYDGLHGPMRQRDPVPGADLLGDAAQAHTARPQLEDGDNGVHQGVADTLTLLPISSFWKSLKRSDAPPLVPVPATPRPAP